MMTISVNTLKKAVAKLSEAELREFRSWYESFDAKLWDEQLESDIARGRLDHLAERALRDYEGATHLASASHLRGR